MYEYENNYLFFDSPGKAAEFNADNRSIYDVYGQDNYIHKRWGSGNMYKTHDSANDSGLLSDTDSQTITNSRHN